MNQNLTYPSSQRKPLADRHREELQRSSGLNAETLERAQISSADAAELRALLQCNDIHQCGIVIPYLHTNDRVDQCDFNVRLDEPIQRGGNATKYLRRAGSDNRLYIPPLTLPVLNDTKIPLILTEGEKKALSAEQQGFDVVAVGGVWNWLQRPRDENGKPVVGAPSNPIADLAMVQWRKRRVDLVFDSDVTTKPAVREALWALRCELVRRGADVFFVQLPAVGDEKVGLDDFLLANAAEEFEALLEAAPPLNFPFRVREIQAAAADERDALLRQLARDLDKTGDAVDRETVRSLLAEEKLFSKSAFGQLLKEQSRGRSDHEGHESRDGVFTANLPNVVDIVTDEQGSVAFLVKEQNKLAIHNSLEHQGTLYLPPPAGDIPFLLTRGKQVVSHFERDDDALYDDVRAYLQSVSDVPEAWYDLLTAFLFHTYTVDFPGVEYSPMIALVSEDAERGKSRTAKGLTYASRRGLLVSDIRDAYLVRYSDEYQGLVTFNSHDISREAERGGSTDLLLNRFERGARTPRVNRPDAGPHRHTVYYNVFGPTIMTNNRALNNLLESRCLELTPPISKRRFDRDVIERDALELKERLTAFRARCMDRALPDVTKPARGRLGDITRPLLQMMRLAAPEREEGLLMLIASIEQERQDTKSEAPDGKLVTVLIKFASERKDDDLIPVEDIAEALSKEGIMWKNAAMTSQAVGHWIKRLGFRRDVNADRKRIENGNSSRQVRCIRLDDINLAVLYDLAEKHGVDWQNAMSDEQKAVTPSQNRDETRTASQKTPVTQSVTTSDSEPSQTVPLQNQGVAPFCDGVTNERRSVAMAREVYRV